MYSIDMGTDEETFYTPSQQSPRSSFSPTRTDQAPPLQSNVSHEIQPASESSGELGASSQLFSPPSVAPSASSGTLQNLRNRSLWKDKADDNTTASTVASNANGGPRYSKRKILRTLLGSVVAFYFYIMFFGFTFIAVSDKELAGRTPTQDVDLVGLMIDSLYFFVESFTTLGFGDIYPAVTWIRAVVCVGLIGALLISAVVVISLDHSIEKILLPYLCNRFPRFSSKMKLIVALVLIIWPLIFWSIVIWLTEHINFGVAIYLSFMTNSTVGYGDVSFKSKLGRSFLIIFAVLTILSFFKGFGMLGEMAVDKLCLFQPSASKQELKDLKGERMD